MRLRGCYQAKGGEQLPIVLGHPHPYASGLPQLSFSMLAAYAGFDAKQSPAYYDAAKEKWTYASPKSFTIPLPLSLPLSGGDTLVVASTSDLFRSVERCRCIKGQRVCTCTCTCAPGGHAPGRQPAADECVTCSFAPGPLVLRPGCARPLFLEEAGYGPSAAAPLETVLAILCSQPNFPKWFAPGRPRRSSGGVENAGRNVHKKTPTTTGPLAHLSFAFGVQCTAPGCSAAAWLGSDSSAGQVLHVCFAGACEHCQVLPCAMHHVQGCTECVAAGILPLSAPYGSAGGVHGAAMLVATSTFLRGTDGGNAKSPTALAAAAARLGGPLTLLSSNRSHWGSGPDNFERLLRDERARIALRSGVTPPTPVSLGGPETNNGKLFEQLVRASRAAPSLLF